MDGGERERLAQNPPRRSGQVAGQVVGQVAGQGSQSQNLAVFTPVRQNIYMY